MTDDAPRRCGVCGSEDVHAYEEVEGFEDASTCLACGAWWYPSRGWIDSDEL